MPAPGESPDRERLDAFIVIARPGLALNLRPVTTDGTDIVIPTINIAPLFGQASAARDQIDQAIVAAASEIGFLLIDGLPATVPVAPARLEELKQVFALSEAQQRGLWRQKFDPAQPNVYRGWFPLQDGHQTYKQGIDIGPDIAYGAAVVDAADPLREATPLPPDDALPGWRALAGAYYRGMELTGQMLMRAIARGLGLDSAIFDDAFTGGISTFRLIHYPVPKAEAAAFAVEHQGQRLPLGGAPHIDSGLVTLLAQDGVSGLQARMHDGSWVDVPPKDNSLVVNFGKLLQSWTGGRIKATEHRVISYGVERYSIPFFYEPRADAVIRPLALAGADFEPFLYGDFVWHAITHFVEFRGLGPLRPPRAALP